MTDLLFAIQSYQDASLPASAQECVNAHAELEPPDAKTSVKVSGVPGIDPFVTCGAGPVRGFCELKGVLYTTSHQEFYSITSSGTVSLLGAGITGTNLVGMDTNGVEICITNGAGGWIYNSNTAVFSQITDSNFNASNSVTAIDDYFIFDEAATNNEFFISPLLAGLGPYDATQFGTADAQPGRVLSVHNVNGNLAVTGEHSIELWQDLGTLSFPWQRILGATIEIGIAAPFAWAEAGGQHYWLGSDLVFYQLLGPNSFTRLSTHALEAQWGQYAKTSDAFCHVVQYSGHKIIYVTFPTGNASFGYDVATQLWHRRASSDPTGSVNRWRANCSVFAFDRLMLVGDSQTGQIGKMNLNNFGTEFGSPIVLDMTAPTIYGRGGKVFMPELLLDMETGVGLATGQGSNPQVALLLSYDSGRTFGSEDWQSLGAQGNFTSRVRWGRKGSGYQITPRIKISDPVKRVIEHAYAPGLRFGPKSQT